MSYAVVEGDKDNEELESGIVFFVARDFPEVTHSDQREFGGEALFPGVRYSAYKNRRCGGDDTDGDKHFCSGRGPPTPSTISVHRTAFRRINDSET